MSTIINKINRDLHKLSDNDLNKIIFNLGNLLADTNKTSSIDLPIATTSYSIAKKLKPKLQKILKKRGTLIGGKWILGDLINYGGNGLIYLTPDKSKIIKLGSINSALILEAFYTTLLDKYDNFQKIFDYGVDEINNVKYIISEKYDSSLSDIESLDELELCELAKFLIQTLEILYNNNLVHRDINRGNIMKKDDKYYLIDFGCSSSVGSRKYFCGTTTYASINNLRHGYPTPFDDLESIAYLLIRMGGNVLPWKKIDSKPDIADMKELYLNSHTLLSKLTKGLPSAYKKFLKMVYKDSKRLSEPRYKVYYNIFDKLCSTL